MLTFLHKIMGFLNKGKYTTNKDAAEIIRRFVNGTSRNPYEWDDFESIKENNPDVNLAIRLCWFFANRFPSDVPTKYCSQKANLFFLKIAEALENNKFQNMDYEETIKYLEKDILSKK